MEITLLHLPHLAREARAANKKYFQKLAQKKPKQLDETALAVHEEVFGEVDCLACANCCKTTSPIFRDRDIDRIAQHLGMRPAAFVETYLRLDEDGDYVHHGAPCPFLGADNYCTIYEARPKACREYPHTDRKQLYQIAQLTLKNTEICPAAFEIVKRLREALPL
jgi:hypothetical protein